ncbi:MAG: acyl carrier protein [Phycisphaerales bacterium]|jgi:acyl carrier protein|nr:phosphopantetheine-binding protein [Planctomycetota bacterium]
MSRDEITKNVQEVLEEALGVDPDEVTMEATLTGDLGAESIDFLDIVFRLEKAFSTPDKPFKIAQGELFSENLLNDPELVADGRITEKGMAALKEKMPHLDFAIIEGDPQVSKLPELFTVKSIVDFIERKLDA